MAGSRISVEVVGSSSELQAAVAKASESLKGLGSVLAKQTDLAMAAGDKTVRMNTAVADSYKRAASIATSSSREASVSYSRSAGEQTAASERVTRAMEAQARAAQVSADQQIRANDMAAASAARAATRQEAAAAKTKASFGAANSELTRMGRTMSVGLLGAAAASTYLAVKFQANTTRLQTQAGATASQVDKLRKGILDMAGQVGFVPNQLADGMYHVVSSMNAVLPPTQRVSGELKILRVSAELAQVGHSNLEETTYALASAMNALREPISNTSKVAGQLNAIVGAGDMTMTDLIDTFKSGLLPTAKTAGVSLQSVGAALAVMGDQGMKGALAGTRLRMSIALLSSPSAAAAKVLQTLGLSAKEATSTSSAMADALKKAGLQTTQLGTDLRQPNGFMVALKDLNDHLRASGLTASGAAAVMNKAFGGGRMGATITLLANSTDRLDAKFKQIGDTGNKFGSSWAATQHTLAFELKSTEATAVALGTKLGTDLLPVVHDLLGDLKDVVHWFEQNHGAVVALEGVVATFATVTIGSLLVSKLKQAIGLAKGFGSALGAGTRLLGLSSGASAGAAGAAGAAGEAGVAGTAGAGAAAAGGLAAAASGLSAVGGIAGLAVVAGLAAQHILNKGIKLPGGTSAQGTANALSKQGAGFAQVDLIKKLQAEGAFGGARADADAVAGGRAIAASLEKGWSQYKFQSEPIMITQLVSKLRGLRPLAQAAAAESAVAFASKLESEGKLPAHSADMMLAQIEQRFPALTAYMGKTAQQAVAAFHVNFDMKRTETDLKATLDRMRGDFPEVVQAMDKTRGSIETKSRAVITSLKNIISTGTTPMRQQAKRDLDALVKTTDSDFGSMVRTVGTNTQSMKNSVSTNTNQSFQIGSANFKGLASNIAAYVGSGAAATAKGLKNITDQVNAELKKFSGGSVSVNQVQAASAGQLAALISGQVSAGGFASPHARGGLVQFGRAGDRGRDNIPVNFGGVPITVGSGEVGAVLNGPQQQFLNARTADVGGLPGVFKKLDRKHYMATGGFVPGFANGGQVNAATGVGGSGTVSQSQSYVFPFAKGVPFSWQRIDQGQDLEASPGAAVLAIAPGIVSQASDRFGGFGPFYPTEQITGGPLAGRGVYYGHTKIVKTGAVSPGDIIAYTQPRADDWTAAPAGWLELGFLPYGSMSAGNAIAPILHQLAAGHTVTGIGGGGGVGGAPVVTWKDIKTPTIGGTGAVADIVRGVMKKAAGAANKFGQKKAASSSGGGVSGGSTAGLSGNEMQIVNQLAQRFGWTNQVADWEYVLNRESNGSLTDTNPSSGAYGLAQFINGPSEYAVYGGNATTYSGQLLAMANYIKQRYGSPSAAAAHERSFNWYAGGGMVKGDVSARAASATSPAWRVMASEESDGGQGAFGFSPGGVGYSVLGRYGRTSDGSALAGYAFGARPSPPRPMWIRHGSRTIKATLQDIGAGSDGPNPAPSIGLYPTAWGDLGMTDNSMVDIQLDSGQSFPSYRGSPIAAFAGKGAGSGSGGLSNTAPAGWTTGLSWQGDKPLGKNTWMIKGGTPDKPIIKTGGGGPVPLETLAGYGTTLGDLETKLAGWNSQYGSLSSRFSAIEGEPQFTDSTGAATAAGIAQQIADTKTLLALANQIEGGYQQELPLVSNALTQFLGARSGTQGSIDADTASIKANRKKVAANKVREASIRTAMLNLQKPSKDTVGALERAIKAAQNKYGPILKKAEAAKARYHGKDKGTKNRLQDAVTAARQTEQGVLQPLEDSLNAERGSTAQRKQRVKAETFHLRQQLQGLVSDDTRIAKADTGLTGTISDLKSILTGKGGAQGENAIISSLESVAAKLGTVLWGKGGQFLGIDTTNQGAAYDEQTTITQLNNTLSGLSGTSTGTGADQALIDSLLQQENLQLSQALELGKSQTLALLSMLPEIPQYKDGGPTIEGLSMLHDSEYVVPQGGALVKSGGSQPVINLTIEHHGAARELSQFIDQRVQHDGNVRVISKKIGQRTSMLTGAPGGFR